MDARWLIASSLVLVAFVDADLGCKGSASTTGVGGTGGGSGTPSATSGNQTATGTGQSTTTGQFSTTGPSMTTGMGGAGSTNAATGTTSTSTASSTSTTTTASTTAASTSATTGVSTSSSSSTGSGTCKTEQLYPPPMNTVNTLYCPFAPASMKFCDPANQHCCEPAMGAAACTASATMCMTGDMDWKCADPVADCGAGSVCCTNTGTAVVQNVVNGVPCPKDYYATGLTSTSCVVGASCGNNAIQLCTNNTECPNGQTCRGFRHAGADIGHCQ